MLWSRTQVHRRASSILREVNLCEKASNLTNPKNPKIFKKETGKIEIQEGLHLSNILVLVQSRPWQEKQLVLRLRFDRMALALAPTPTCLLVLTKLGLEFQN